MSPLRFVRQFLLVTFFALFAGSCCLAQITNVTDTTSTPVAGRGHDYIQMLDETVNPANGAVSVRIQVPVPPARNLTVPFAFAYDSNGVHNFANIGVGFVWTSDKGFLAQGGWTYTVPMMSADVQEATFTPDGGETVYYCDFTTDYMFYDTSGTRHPLYLSNVVNSTQQCSYFPSQPQEYLQRGDDFVGATLASDPNNINPRALTVTDASGTVYSFSTQNQSETTNPSTASFFGLPGVIEDSNGNIAKITDNGHGAFTVTDTAGRTAISSSGFGTTGNTITISGLSNPYTLTWGTANTNFLPSHNIIQQFVGCNTPPRDTETQPVITAITLPNGKQYQFFYDSTYGLLNKIVYPTGGYVSYTWGLNHLSQGGSFSFTSSNGTYGCAFTYDTEAVIHRYVSFDGTNVALQQDFTYSTTFPSGSYYWTTKQTTVTTHDLVRGTSWQTVYNYTPGGLPGQPNAQAIDPNQVPLEQSVVYKDVSGVTLQTVTKAWFDPYLLGCQLTTLDNGQIAGAWYTYGVGAQITDKKEYDYGLITSTSSCYSNSGTVSPPSGFAPTKETAITYQTFPTWAGAHPCKVVTLNSSSTAVAETDYLYDGGLAVCGTPGTSATASVSNLATGTHDETLFGPSSSTSRGNATKIIRKCLQSCADSTTSYTFDETGKTTSSTDACGNATCSDMTGAGHTTQYLYADNFDSNPAKQTNAYLTKVIDPLGHTSNFKYAYSDGQLISSSDPNNLTTTYQYNDSLRRLTETDFPDSGQTTLSYNDTAPSPTVTTTKKINLTQTITAVSKRDGMGHVVQGQLTSDPQGAVFSDTTFDALGRVWKQSNPYRGGTDATSSPGTTIFTYDALGRRLTTTYPDNSVQTTAYCGPNTLATDPTGKWRRSRVDGSGRLVEVDEPNAIGASVASNGCPGTGEPILVTTYGNDLLGNLISVLQNGSHARSFTHDSLSRLLTSTNPEVGTITYTYDANSNLSTKKDARNITTTYSYDVLNRTKSVTYSNSDPAISINYDEVNCLGLTTCQNIGQRTSMTDAAGSEAWSYQTDSANKRSVHVNQRTNISTPSNVTRTSTYYLDLAGNITQMVYPSGRIVNYAYDNANRPKSASDGTSGGTYATAPVTPLTGCPSAAVCYTPQGSVYSMSIGQTSSFTGLNINETFNNRLQPKEIKASSTGGNAFDLSYNYIDPVSGKNAGHVYGTINNLDTTRSQSFTYDQLNRITSAQTSSTYATSPTHCWGETYQYDGVPNGAWGNLTQIAATTNSAYTGCSQESGFTKTVDANNHISGLTYDAAGNTSNDGTYTYNWNAESQLTSTSANIYYRYDGDGRRAAKTDYHGNPTKLYWYGSGGEILSETNSAAYLIYDYIFFGGKRVAQVSNAPNLNGGFESGAQNWSASGSGTASIVNNAANAHSGSSYAELSVPAGSGISTAFTSTVPTSAQIGETITATGWVYREQNGQQYSRWWMTVTGSNGAQGGHAADNTTMNAWIQQSISVTVPSWLQGPYTVTVWAEVDATSTTQATSARFDDATLNGNTLLFAEDSLGTTRVTTDPSGLVCYDADFYPFGGERTPYVNTCTQNVYKFEGKERDTETGNDDFGARYYSNRFGRWLSADWSSVPVPIPYANLTNPQTLNLYSMVSDDPESFADLDGHELTVAAELQGVVATLRAESPSFNAELSAYEGPNAPNLVIQFGATPDDASGAPTIGNTNAPLQVNPVIVTNIPPGPNEDGTEYSMKNDSTATTTVTINNNIKKDNNAVLSTTEHEVGHAKDARTNTNQYGHDSFQTQRTKGKTPHDDRPEEKRANDFKRKVEKERKEHRKEEKRRRKEAKKKKKFMPAGQL